MSSQKKGSKAILVALFAALTCAGCFIQIPLPGGIPIVLQDMLAMLCGLLLGPLYGSLSVFIFLVLGSIGLPVFAGKAGIQCIFGGPTGGFLIGYCLSAFVGGLVLHLFLNQNKDHSTLKTYFIIVLACLCATVTVFAGGIIGFKIVTNSSMAKTISAVLLPFIPGNLIKLVLMVFITKKFRPVIKNYL